MPPVIVQSCLRCLVRPCLTRAAPPRPPRLDSTARPPPSMRTQGTEYRRQTRKRSTSSAPRARRDPSPSCQRLPAPACGRQQGRSHTFCLPPACAAAPCTIGPCALAPAALGSPCLLCLCASAPKPPSPCHHGHRQWPRLFSHCWLVRKGGAALPTHPCPPFHSYTYSSYEVDLPFGKDFRRLGVVLCKLHRSRNLGALGGVPSSTRTYDEHRDGTLQVHHVPEGGQRPAHLSCTRKAYEVPTDGFPSEARDLFGNSPAHQGRLICYCPHSPHHISITQPQAGIPMTIPAAGQGPHHPSSRDNPPSLPRQCDMTAHDAHGIVPISPIIMRKAPL